MTKPAANSLRVSNPKEFGRVAVLMGGLSFERDISLMTGKAVQAGLERGGVDAHAIDVGHDVVRRVGEGRFDRAWIALHGLGGEDGMIQGVLEYLGIPYTGSGVLGSALSMDKLCSKQLFSATGLGTPPYQPIRGEEDFSNAVTVLGLPLITKPASSGSSLGLTKVETAGQLPAAYAMASGFDNRVLAESWITGPEYSASILDGVALPLIRIETPNTFYDYEAKYFTDATRYHCPSGLKSDDEQRFSAAALRAFEVVGAEGWGRVDFIVADDGEPLMLEVNTIPGMTDHSLVPMAAREIGIDFDELVWRILETSFARKRNSLQQELTETGRNAL